MNPILFCSIRAEKVTNTSETDDEVEVSNERQSREPEKRLTQDELIRKDRAHFENEKAASSAGEDIKKSSSGNSGRKRNKVYNNAG